jgi:hypothetical protein
MSVNNNLQTGSGRIRVAQFTASGTWTAPAGVYSVNVLGVGGGGAGGNAQYTGATQTGSLRGAGGGGGGGGVFDGLVPVTPGTSYTVTIGSAGISAAAVTAGGGSGGNTAFGSLITCPGGQGGVSQSVGTASNSVRSPGYASTNPGGSWGGNGIIASNGTLTGSFGGGAACRPFLTVYPAASTVAAYINSTHVVSTIQYNNGYGNVQMPYANIDLNYITTNSIGSADPTTIWNTETPTLNLPYIKRNRALNIIPSVVKTIIYGGASWKSLGGGGGAHNVLTLGTISMVNPSNDFLDPNAGYTDVPKAQYGGTISTDTNINGTSAANNSGAGGGGARAPYATGLGLASGGNGGSGYLEVTWVE